VDRIPVTLLTGFLGSGKTSLLNALLTDPAQASIFVIVNEVGAVGLDHLLVDKALDGANGTAKVGCYEANGHGLYDMLGNVWEWTNTCVANTYLTADGAKPETQQEYCGAHIAEGKHRAIVIDLVRDPKVGGCAAGLPADYVGFRLVLVR